MLYSKEVIDKVSEWIGARSMDAQAYLVVNKLPEWVATVEAIFVTDKSFDWLTKNNFPIMAAFVKAIEGEKKSLEFLIKNKAAHLAATANAVNRDKGAEEWLIKNNLQHYARLAEIIRKKLEKMSDSDLSYLFKGPF